MINLPLTYEEATLLIAGILAHRATGRAEKNKLLENYCESVVDRLLRLTSDHLIQERQHEPEL